MKLSVIIPTLDEESCLGQALASVPAGSEVIVADGRSEDRTTEIAAQFGARVVPGAPGRGAQMNRGAGASTGDTLLFLHADCELPSGAGDSIREALADLRVVGGSFRLHITPARGGLRLVAIGSNLRARLLRLPYGDQALFVRRSVFETMGGYSDIPIMEDVDFSKRLRRRGRVVSLENAVTTTPRHWEKLGPFLTTLLNWAAVLAFFVGVPPKRLAPVYHRLRKASRPSAFAKRFGGPAVAETHSQHQRRRAKS
jgi:rSAM/selenodomain-associated transferase 2